MMSSNFYQIQGGGLPADAPIYVRRQIDYELEKFTQSDRRSCGVCYILAPRQTGKTSLMNHTSYELSRKGIICVTITLQSLGTFDAESPFYFNLIRQICQEILKFEVAQNQGLDKLLETLDKFWYQYSPDVQPTVRFQEFLITEVLLKINTNLVIFIDEIQTLISWKLQDSFIGFLKSLSETNSEPALKKVAFVLLGFAKPSDLVSNYLYAFNFAKYLELGYLEGNCEPLQQGLQSVTGEPAKTLKAILHWTGGQPYLTEVLCDLVVKSSKNLEEAEIDTDIESVVCDKIIKKWREENQDYNYLFRGIENWFAPPSSKQIAIKLAALRIYRGLLSSGKNSLKFDEYDARHWELLISGLAIKREGYLNIANPIYEQIFEPDWVYQREKCLQDDSMSQKPFSTIYNRDVFILIDQSGSMVRKDDDTSNQTRFQYLQEIVEGHIYSILSEETSDDKNKICDIVSVYFFSRNEVDDYPIKVTDAGQVQSLFLENKPKAKTFIGPTLEKCLDIWLAEGKPKNRGAFFIIYTDGLFDDEPRFVQCLEKACKNIDSEKVVKFIVFGLGKDIDEKKFLELDFNVNESLPHNILMFNLVNEVDHIIGELERELVDEPGLAFPEWVKKKYPDFVKKVTEAHQSRKS